MIYAPRGISKTYVALNIAYAVATGSGYLRWQAEKPRGVLYLDREMPAKLMQERIQAITRSQPAVLKAPFRLLTPDMQEGAIPDLSIVVDQEHLNEFIEDI